MRKTISISYDKYLSTIMLTKNIKISLCSAQIYFNNKHHLWSNLLKR